MWAGRWPPESTYTCPRCLLCRGQKVSQTEEPGAAGGASMCRGARARPNQKRRDSHRRL